MAAILGPLGNLYQGQQNSGVSDYNAEIATQNAQVVEGQGAAEAQASLVQSRKAIGAGAAAYGASGTAAAGGSAQWVLRAGAQQGALSALTIQNNTAIKATAYENEAAFDQFQGANDITAGQIGALTTAIGESSQVTSSMNSSGSGSGSSGAAASGGEEAIEGSSTASMAEMAEMG